MGLITAVDVDDPSTWPAAIFEWSSGYAERLRDSTEYPGDLEIPLDQEDEFRALFADYKLLAYHCTRLLDHESSVIREHGLLTLTPQIVARRLAEAHEHGFLTDAQLGHLHSKGVFSNGRVEAGEIREGQVCFVLGHAPFSEPNNGCLPLLESWGGEGLNGGPLGGQPWNLAVGQPSIVVAQIDLSISHLISPTYPALANVFVASLLDLGGCYADVFLRSAVPASDILEIWQPGDPSYNRYPHLPT